jgi:hypothetical protein
MLAIFHVYSPLDFPHTDFPSLFHSTQIRARQRACSIYVWQIL